MAVRGLSNVQASITASDEEEFVIFTTRVNRAIKGDTLSQQYEILETATGRGQN